MPSARNLEIEVVMFGYYDPRVEDSTPFGFAIRTGPKVVVHHRIDVIDHGLPPAFTFTTKNLPAIIGKAWSKAVAPDHASLHKFLLEHCFDGLGSLRCWNPINEIVSPDEIDGYVLAVRGLVDQQVEAYRSKLLDFHESCSPSWKRSPEPEGPRTMPEVCGANA